MTEHSFYAVGHGKKPGVYEQWAEVQEQAFRFHLQIKDFPQPVYKKFATKEEAEEYVKARRPEKISLEVDEKADKFYAVARGKVVGIFTDYNDVKNHIAGYPQPLYKKFEKLDDAKAYYSKYSSEEENGNIQESKAHNTAANNNEEEIKVTEKTEQADEEESVFYAVAHGHKTGIFKTLEEFKEATKDFENAKFQKFDSEEDAKLFVMSEKVNNSEDRKRPHSPDNAPDGVEEKSAKTDVKTSHSKKSGFYAVARGRKPGVYERWFECAKQVKGFQNAKYKKFATKNEALAFMLQNSGRKSLELNSREQKQWEGVPIVYTDGACSFNGHAGAVAGIGVYWGENHVDNISEPLQNGLPTNNRAELTAVIRAVQMAVQRNYQRIIVRTDSNLLIQTVNTWIHRWKQNGWKTANGSDVKNKDLIIHLDNLLKNLQVRFEHVAGHAGILGNERADQLARDGAARNGQFCS
ncbi:unnamed protein product [Thelazia callipaeda]|uniref:Ribonuclease H n=1 Tax=Thelazia callipaeda TaxID=103827 RepID=A0A0N5CVX1_THECL|nr:unnamed protein product [Thelazia callipaeda]